MRAVSASPVRLLAIVGGALVCAPASAQEAAPDTARGRTATIAQRIDEEGAPRRPDAAPQDQPAAAARRPVQPRPPAATGRARPTAQRQNERAYDAAIDAEVARKARREAERLERIEATPVEAAGPFDPLGVRWGSFVLRPALTASVGVDDNVLRTNTNRKASLFEILAPELSVGSDWSRHALDADIRGSYTTYNSVEDNDRPELDAALRGRLDVTDMTRVIGEARHRLTTEAPGSADAPTDARRPPLVTTTGGTVGVVHRWNRLEVGLRGSVDHVWYEDAVLRNGGRTDNSDRIYDEYGLRLRASYEVSPGVRPFVEARIDTRQFQRAVDDDGFRRESDGRQVLVGSSFELSRLLTGELAVGWLERDYVDPRLDTASGLLAEGSLVWAASGLTNVRLAGRTAVDESTLAGTTSVFRRDLSLSVEHAFRRWLIGTATIGHGTDDYGGAGRFDERWSLSAGLAARLGRSLWLTGEARHERLDSNLPNTDYTANIVLVGLRLQR